MISSFVAPRARRRALLAGAAAAVAALGAGGVGAPSAHAAFTLPVCGGSTFRAQGSTFQNSLQATMKTIFEGPTSAGCNGTPPGPAYTSNGSGNGNAAMGAGGGSTASPTLVCVTLGRCTAPLDPGVRDPFTSLSSTDEPPTPTQQQAIDAGTASPSDDGVIHVIPIATGASVLIMHVPEGCDISGVTNLTNGTTGTVGGADTGDRASDHTQRIRLNSATVEAAFAGAAGAQTWGDIAPGISGTATGITGGDMSQATTACRDVPVRRIVRSDSSGTTYSWKAYLALIDPGRGWLTTYNAPNTQWPALGAGAAVAPQQAIGAACTSADDLCANPSTGGGGLAAGVVATDGSIGYVDLATARSRGFDTTPGATQDYTMWSPLQNDPGGSSTGYAEPTSSPAAHTTATTTKGANCASAPISNVPDPARSPNGDPTQGDWSRTYAAGGQNYPACVLTYVLAWDDDAPVYGNNDVEQAKARTVKDWLQKVLVSTVGQNALFGADYSPLPTSGPTPLLTWSQTAVDAIDWNKSAGSGGGGGNGGGNNGGGNNNGGGGNVGGGGGTRAAPSNAFSLPSSSASARGLAFAVQLPGAGTLKVDATSKVGKKTIKVASVTARASAGGRVRVKLSLSAKARTALAKAKSHKLKITVKFTFTPTGGSARSVTKTVTVRAPAKKHKAKKKKGGHR